MATTAPNQLRAFKPAQIESSINSVQFHSLYTYAETVHCNVILNVMH